MNRLIPRSLAGQLAVVMTLALLLASAVNFALLLNERRQAGLAEASGPTLTRFADAVFLAESAPRGELDRLSQRALMERLFARGPPAARDAPAPGAGADGARRPPFRERGPGPGRLSLLEESLVETRGLVRSRGMERRLSAALTEAGGTTGPNAVRASARIVDGARFQPRFREDAGDRFRRARAADRNGGRARQVVLSARLADGRWLNSESFVPAPPPLDAAQLAVSTLVLFASVLGAALLLASRLSRPLGDLAKAAAGVGASGEPQQVVVRGPADVQQTIEAFNAMSRRVSQLLAEKDMMLGALGHDLRTPLTSLRIRLETMEPAVEREKAVRTIEETTRLLETILELARKGRSSEPLQTIDLSDMAQDMAREYAEAASPVSLGTVATAWVEARPMLLRRAVRNLIDNAIAYGRTARLIVETNDGLARLVVEDEGAGMSAETMAAAREPFVRGEASRNRRTGGAGLGLALVDAIAKTHGGELTLENRAGGFRAGLALPAASPRAATASRGPNEP